MVMMPSLVGWFDGSGTLMTAPPLSAFCNWHCGPKGKPHPPPPPNPLAITKKRCPAAGAGRFAQSGLDTAAGSAAFGGTQTPAMLKFETVPLIFSAVVKFVASLSPGLGR